MMPNQIQGILGFIPAEDAGLLQSKWESTVKRREAQLNASRSPRIAKSVNQEIMEALEMPLFSLAQQSEAEDRSDCEFAETTASPWLLGEERPEFTPEEIAQLHGLLLEESIKALAAKGNPKEKLDILEWVFEPDYICAIKKVGADGNPRTIHLFTDDVPWTFAFCCALEGNDPDVYRKFIRQRMPEAVKRFYLVH